jgi:hypothetical protein
VKYKLTSDDLVFIEWLKGFASYVKVKSIKENEETYFWIKYTKVLEDLYSIFPNIYSIRKTIKKLSDPSKPSPLMQKIIYSQKGAETYFAFNPIIMDELEGKEMNSLFSEAPIQPKINPKDKDFHKVPANPNCIEILKTLKKIKENGKPLFINHILPTDKNHYNSTFEHFQDAMLCLYEGRFLTKYNLGKTDEWWRNKYKFYLNENKIQFVIKECKGNWDQIQKIMIEAAKNYSKWFDIDTEVYNKNSLPRSVNDWIFNAHSKTSMFYVSLLNPPTSAREADAEKTFNNINPKIRSMFNDLYQNEWDGFTFWNKISNLVKWYEKYATKLCMKDTNCYYWLDLGIKGFLKNYKAWLLEFTDNKPSIKNIGINNATFDVYIKQKVKDHGIEIEIPRSL